MYLRAIHAEESIPLLRDFIVKNPLGILTTAIANRGENQERSFIQSSHIPWVLDVKDPSDQNALPTLRGHIARQNPQAKSITDEDEVLIPFNGPAHHYVTPKFYGKTKPETGKVVPTWNYSAVEAYGRATVWVDHAAKETTSFLQRQIRDLTDRAEHDIMGYEKTWKVDDAPEKYIEIMSKNIIGIEVEVTRLGGKSMMSQEMSEGDVRHVVDGFRGLETDVGDEMAATIDGKLTQRLSKQKGTT
ncbi:negative transcriptional regulator [Hortaea werneckii]|nr:negative transcriptional regulator [Hortaea werneckii]KAI7101831.1 negative transcriptional regulator [Hortaea werneckii]KAI7243191.1 negative transcriptional regulator [Hortaea werneckii]KAI7330576.1 negative transcriptional regulator [Hortaea werneckii]KAI7400815.1 negative transcriptional regulator [Hortaea werneckii]